MLLSKMLHQFNYSTAPLSQFLSLHQTLTSGSTATHHQHHPQTLSTSAASSNNQPAQQYSNTTSPELSSPVLITATNNNNTNENSSSSLIHLSPNSILYDDNNSISSSYNLDNGSRSTPPYGNTNETTTNTKDDNLNCSPSHITTPTGQTTHNKSFTIAAILGLHNQHQHQHQQQQISSNSNDAEDSGDIIEDIVIDSRRADIGEVMNLSVQHQHHHNHLSSTTITKNTTAHITSHPTSTTTPALTSTALFVGPAATSLLHQHHNNNNNNSLSSATVKNNITPSSTILTVQQQQQSFNTSSTSSSSTNNIPPSVCGSSSGSLTQRSTDRATLKHISSLTASNKKTAKSKRVRTIFTPEQLERLEAEFERQQYMVGPERLYLAHTLQLTEAQVKVWFQNRRIKWRKHHLEITHQRLAVIKQQQLQHQLLQETDNTMDSSSSGGPDDT